MKPIAENSQVLVQEPREDFSWARAIVMILLVLGFLGAAFYILVSSYMEIN